MHFCLVGPTYPFRGGIAHYTSMLALQLRQHGHKVSLCSFSRGYPQLLYPGRTDRDPSRQPLRVQVQYLINPWHPWTWKQVANCIAADRPDAVLIEWWVPYWAPMHITIAKQLRRLGVPTFIDCQNVLPHESHPLDRTLTRLTLRQAHACIIYSIAHRQELLDVVPGVPHALVPFPAYDSLARAIPDRCEARRQLELDGHVALFFGFVRPYKGLSVLLRAAAQVIQRLPFHLLIVGEFWHGGSDYRRTITDLGIESNTTVVDRYVPDEELGLYFAAADVVVMPYLASVQSGVLALAQAFQKPVIASRVGGLEEGIVDGQTGLLVEPNNVIELAKAIFRFFKENLGQTMAPYLQAITPDADWELVIKALVDLSVAARAGSLAGWSAVYGQNRDGC